MPTFRQSRDFLLANRTDYAKAVAGFRWPDPVPFNWAIDWFDAELANAAEQGSLRPLDRRRGERRARPGSPSASCRSARTRSPTGSASRG